MAMRLKPIILVYLALGTLMLALSGRAEGLASPRILLMMLAPAALLHILWALGVGLYKLARHRTGQVLLDAVAPTFFIACVWGGLKLDEIAVARTQARGDILIAQIETYRQATGNCPADMDALRTSGVEPPSPALFSSGFQLENCSVWFPAPIFITCAKGPQSEEWYCAD